MDDEEGDYRIHLAHLNVQPDTCEVVVAGFMHAAPDQRLERDFDVLGSYSEEFAMNLIEQ